MTIHLRLLLLGLLATGLLGAGGCLGSPTRVQVDPISVKPIHVEVDVVVHDDDARGEPPRKK